MPTYSASADNLNQFNASGTPIVPGDTVLLKNRAGGHMTTGGRGETIAVKVEDVHDTLGLKVRYRRTDGGPLETAWFKPDGVDRVGDQNNSTDCCWTGDHSNCRHTPVMPVGRLAAMNSRDEAHRYLAGVGLTKPQLLDLAYMLKVDTGRGDNMKTIRRKIVDATAGTREDAEAIRDGVNAGRQQPDPSPAAADPDDPPPAPAPDSKLDEPPERWPHGDSGIEPENAWDGDPLYRDQQVIPENLDHPCGRPGCTGRCHPVPGTDSWDADGTATIDTKCDGTREDGSPCGSQSFASWYWPEAQPPSEDTVWTSQQEDEPPDTVQVAKDALILKPMLARNRYTDEEWAIANAGQCNYVVEYGMGAGGIEHCKKASHPGSVYRFCAEHDEMLQGTRPLDPNQVVVCPRCGYHSQPGQALGNDHCHFTACGNCGQVSGPDRINFSYCLRCGCTEYLYDIPETAIPKWRQQVYDTKDAFQYEYCTYCGKDLNRHVAQPDMLGNLSLICLDPETTDDPPDQPTPPGTPSRDGIPTVEVDSPETLAAAVKAIRGRAEENRNAAVDYEARAREDTHDVHTMLGRMKRLRFTSDDVALVATLRDPSMALLSASVDASNAAAGLFSAAETAHNMARTHVAMQQRGAVGAFYR